MSANEKQVDGDHYQKYGNMQHWDIVTAYNLDYFQAQILRYILRWKDKDGPVDLEKAKHMLEKYIEVVAEFPEQYTQQQQDNRAKGCGKLINEEGTKCGDVLVCQECFTAHTGIDPDDAELEGTVEMEGEATPHYLDQDRR